MQEIPLQATPSQLTNVVLGGQNCQISIYQKAQGLFVDLNVNGTDLVVGVIARDCVPLMAREYEVFAGNLIFVDTEGSNDPTYDGLGARYGLVYLSEAENALIQ